MRDQIQVLFDEKLPAAMEKHPTESAHIGATYQFNVTGEGGGEWFIDVSSSGPSVERGSRRTADCEITISAEDFEKLYADPRNRAMPLYLEGKLTVKGNPMYGMRLQELFRLVK
jgi:hypothetical protein